MPRLTTPDRRHRDRDPVGVVKIMAAPFPPVPGCRRKEEDRKVRARQMGTHAALQPT